TFAYLLTSVTDCGVMNLVAPGTTRGPDAGAGELGARADSRSARTDARPRRGPRRPRTSPRAGLPPDRDEPRTTEHRLDPATTRETSRPTQHLSARPPAPPGDVRAPSRRRSAWRRAPPRRSGAPGGCPGDPARPEGVHMSDPTTETETPARRSEEHTSELQSRDRLVCRLLLEKK